MKFSARRNLRLTYTFTFMWMFIPLIPIFVPYLTSMDLSMKEIFLLQAYFGLVVALLEVPSGYIADLYGRVFALRLGTLCAAVAFTYLCFVESFWQLILYETMIGISLSLVSGADFSLLYDSLKASRLNRREIYSKTVSRFYFILLVAEASSSIFAAFAALHSMYAVIVMTAVFAWAPVALTFFLVEPPTERLSKHSHAENFQKVFRFIFVESDFMRLLFVNMTIWSLSTFCAVWIIQKVWMEESLPIFWFGIIWGIFQLVSGLTSRMTHLWEARYGAPTLMVLSASLVISGYLGLALLEGMAVILIGVVFYLARGLTSVIYKDAMNWRMPSEFRATANSVQSFCFRGSFIIIGPLIGWSLDTAGTDRTLLYLALAFALSAILALAPLIQRIRRQIKTPA